MADEATAAALQEFLQQETGSVADKVRDWCKDQAASLERDRATFAAEQAAARDAATEAEAELKRQRAVLDERAAKLQANSDRLESWMRSGIQHEGDGAEGDVICINVGGRTFTTTRGTLCAVEDSPLAAMASRWELPRDDDGTMFLDRNPDAFGVILECLRNPGLSARDAAIFSGVDTSLVSAEIDYLGLGSLLGYEGTPLAMLSDVNSQLSAACAQAVKTLVDSTFAKVAAPVMARMAAPDVETVPTQMFPSKEEVGLSSYSWGQQVPGSLLPDESIVACVSNSGSNSQSYFCVTNMCRTCCVYRSSLQQAKWAGNPLAMSREYIEIMKAVPNGPGNAQCPYTVLVEKYKAFNPHVAYTIKTQEMLREAARKLEQAEELRDTNERQLAEVAEGRKSVAAGQAANDKERASLVKRMQRVAKREQSVEVGEQLTAVRAQLEAAGTELLDACDTVEKDLVGRSIAAALETLESVKV